MSSFSPVNVFVPELSKQGCNLSIYRLRNLQEQPWFLHITLKPYPWLWGAAFPPRDFSSFQTPAYDSLLFDLFLSVLNKGLCNLVP